MKYKIKYLLFLLVNFTWLSGCQSLSLDMSQGEKENYKLELKTNPGDLQVMQYHHVETIRSFFEGVVFDEKVEVSRFLGQFQDLGEKRESPTVKGLLSTSDMRGTLALGDLGFPPEGEPLVLEVTPQGQVLKAGEHARDSIFYVPSVPLPQNQVQVGDTWNFDALWSTTEGLPLKIEAAVIFKKTLSCGNKHVCAVLEVSGNTKIVPPYDQLLPLESELSGLMLFDIDGGILVESLIKSADRTVSLSEGIREVDSCLHGQLVKTGLPLELKEKLPLCN